MDRAEIEFVNATPADATRLAEDLASFLRIHVIGADPEVTGGSGETMDLGATVALLLGAPAIGVLAKGLADWIRRQGDPDLVIKTKKGSVTVKGGLDLAAKREIILAAFDHDAV